MINASDLNSMLISKHASLTTSVGNFFSTGQQEVVAANHHIKKQEPQNNTTVTFIHRGAVKYLIFKWQKVH